jgi:hypothetical protein
MRTLILIGTLLACGGGFAQAQSGSRANTRQGFWFGFGLGGGSAGTDCTTSCSSDRFTGASGYFRLGGTLSRSLLVGVESNGWLHSEGGVDESIGFGSVVALWYPSPTGALYVKVGLGGMRYRADDGVDVLTATGPSASLGLGYEMRLGRNMSLVPYLNSLASSSVKLRINGAPVSTNEAISLNLFQFGLGITWH